MSGADVEKHYDNGELVVVWRPALCMHSRRCWKELPSVFDPNKRPWLTITGADTAAIAAQVRRCPSRALSLLGDDADVLVADTVVAPEPAVPAPVAKPPAAPKTVRREQLIHRLHEAAELEHALMCTYLYAAFSLRMGEDEGLTETEARATARWRAAIIDVAVEEMGHLAAVWNLTSALGGSPRFGRANFPVDSGLLPAAVVARLARFDADTLQHFVHLERPTHATEPDGAGFSQEQPFVRGAAHDRLTPMAFDYATVGELYTTIEAELRAFVAHHGERATFSGDPAFALGPRELSLDGVAPVTDLASALASLAAIVEQGEGAPDHSEGSHFARFAAIREELAALRAARPDFDPAHPAASNPVLRRPLPNAARVQMENEDAATVVDIANAAYALMLRLLAYAYVLPTSDEKRLVVTLGVALMRAVTLLGERAARMPAGPSNPGVNAGVSFTALRDTAPLPVGYAARRYIIERFSELTEALCAMEATDPRVADAARIVAGLWARASAELPLDARAS